MRIKVEIEARQASCNLWIPFDARFHSQERFRVIHCFSIFKELRRLSNTDSLSSNAEANESASDE
jgi:hypothetical protein